MFKRITVIVLILVFAFGISTFAQKKTTSLSNKGGIGIQVGHFPSIGGHLFYYLSNNSAIGAHFGFIFDGGTGRQPSTTSLLFAPYFNYYITKLTNTLWFYGQGVFTISTGTYSSYDPQRAEYVKSTSTYTSINVNTGLEWRVTKLTNIYGGVKFISFYLDPTRFKAGVMEPFIGVNWVIF